MSHYTNNPLVGLMLVFLLIVVIFGIPCAVVLRDVSIRAETNRELRAEVEEEVHAEMMPHIEAAFVQGMAYAQRAGLVDLDDDQADTVTAL